MSAIVLGPVRTDAGSRSGHCWRTASAAAICYALAALLCVCFAAAQDAPAVSILSPAIEETIQDNNGNVSVRLELRSCGAGCAIRVLLDGQPYSPDQHDSSFVLENLDRGEHVLQVQMLDSAGKIVAESSRVKFYMWRASALFPPRKPPR